MRVRVRMRTGPDVTVPVEGMTTSEALEWVNMQIASGTPLAVQFTNAVSVERYRVLVNPDDVTMLQTVAPKTKCTCEHGADDHGWMGCEVEGCRCEAEEREETS